MYGKNWSKISLRLLITVITLAVIVFHFSAQQIIRNRKIKLEVELQNEFNEKHKNKTFDFRLKVNDGVNGLRSGTLTIWHHKGFDPTRSYPINDQVLEELSKIKHLDSLRFERLDLMNCDPRFVQQMGLNQVSFFRCSVSREFIQACENSGIATEFRLPPFTTTQFDDEGNAIQR